MQSIAGAKARIRIEQQRDGLARMAKAIDGAGFHRSAAEFRKEAERSIQRAEAFELERATVDEDRASLAEIRAILDAELPDARRDGRKLTDSERVAWIVQQWKAVSRELATSERTT